MQELTKTNFVDLAENVIKGMVKTDKWGNPKIALTTSKIRNLLSMTNVLYNSAKQMRNETLSEDILHDIQYLKMRFAYESGREQTVKEFVESAGILKYIDKIGTSRENLLLFCGYMEALVAYHKFYGGKER